MDFSCFTTQQMVYQPLDDFVSVSISGSKSVSCWLSWAYVSRIQNQAQGRDVREYTCPPGKLLIRQCWALDLLPVGAGVIAGGGGIGSVVGWLSWSGVAAPDPLHLQHVCGFIVLPFWQERHPAMWFYWSITGCLSIAASTFYFPGHSTPRFFSSRTSAWCFLCRYYVSLLRRKKTLLCPFWPDFRPGAWRTAPAVPDLLALV